ncbi:hypothetical protein N7410_18725 [Klebsiella pasteurii]|nr:hypothetical protein [Klebsiella pasteurii]MDH0313306.1 hypothetical protein [Klebsiella pasteurii]
MSPIYILDNSSAPARYGITASLWANRLGLPLWSLRPNFAGDVPDSHQHVIRAGCCAISPACRHQTSSLCWRPRRRRLSPTCRASGFTAMTAAIA